MGFTIFTLMFCVTGATFTLLQIEKIGRFWIYYELSTNWLLINNYHRHNHYHHHHNGNGDGDGDGNGNGSGNNDCNDDGNGDGNRQLWWWW